MGDWGWGHLYLYVPKNKPAGLDDLIDSLSYDEFEGAEDGPDDSVGAILTPGEIFHCSGEIANYGCIQIEDKLREMGIAYDITSGSSEGEGWHAWRPGMEEEVYGVSSDGHKMIRAEDVENAIKACKEYPWKGGRSLAEVLTQDVLPPAMISLEDLKAKEEKS
jgi:hypothetical protein